MATLSDFYDADLNNKFPTKQSVELYLKKKHIGYREWNNGLIVIKHNSSGYYMVWWHKDFQGFIDLSVLQHLAYLNEIPHKASMTALNTMIKMDKLIKTVQERL